MNVKKVMYVILFTNQCPAIQIAVPKWKSVNYKFYKGKNRRPATGLRCVRLLHDIALSRKAAIVRESLKQEIVALLPTLLFYKILPLCDFF
jgi:hypothetical protein